MTGPEFIPATSGLIKLASKYGGSAAGMVLNAIGRWRSGRRMDRIEGILDYVDTKASSYRLPDDFAQNEDFEDFSAAVLEVALHTASTRKQKILGQFLLNEPDHGIEVKMTAKSKILELLTHIQAHHLELLRRFDEAKSKKGADCPKITDWDNSLASIQGSTDDRLDLFYSTASDLLRWFLIRSSPTPSGVNIAGVAYSIPGTSNASHLRITWLGEQMMGYVKDPKGAFDNFDAILNEEEG